jgi:WhiB family redox-sensing transcriptional regulator
MAPIPLLTVNDNWLDHAICKGHQRWFFGPDKEMPGARARREAVAVSICNACPVKLECRQWARDNREQGVWGGETDEGRTLAGHPPRDLARRTLRRLRVEALSQAS